MKTEFERLKRGDCVRVRLEGRTDDWTPAFVGLASDSNPSSVMLMLTGIVRAKEGWIAERLPLSIDYEAETAISLWGDSYELEISEDHE
jgi:hypothetical protein